MNLFNGLSAIVLTIATSATQAVVHRIPAIIGELPAADAVGESGNAGGAFGTLRKLPAEAAAADRIGIFRSAPPQRFESFIRLAKGHPTQGTQSKNSAQGMSEEEIRLRRMLLQRSQGFGGIFAPLMQGIKHGGGKGSAKGCGPYTDHAACQAYKAGDGWAAERLQNHRSTPSERDWYDR